MTQFYDAREIQALQVREQALMTALPRALARARSLAPALMRQLQDIDFAAVDSRAALARPSVVRKHELLAQQQAAYAGRRVAARDDTPLGPQDVFGGFSTIGWGAAARVFASPGPIYEPESQRSDYWRFARAMFAAAFRPAHAGHGRSGASGLCRHDGFSPNSGGSHRKSGRGSVVATCTGF